MVWLDAHAMRGANQAWNEIGQRAPSFSRRGTTRVDNSTCRLPFAALTSRTPPYGEGALSASLVVGGSDLVLRGRLRDPSPTVVGELDRNDVGERADVG